MSIFRLWANRLADYFRFVKLEHTLFSLPVIFAGAALAGPNVAMEPSHFWRTIFWISMAGTGARSFGFAVNRILDRKIDALNPRTSSREIPAGKISVRFAWLFSLLSAIIYTVAAGQISTICLLLSPIPLLLFLLYPFLKRWTAGTHFGLGIAWGMAPLGGWLAVKPEIFHPAGMLPVFVLFLFCIFWVAGFDIVYALLDEVFDRKAGVYSIPAIFGRANALRISELCHFVAFAILGTLVQLWLNRPVSFGLLFLIGFLLAASHWKLAREKELSTSLVDFAFFKVNALVSFLLFFIMIGVRHD